MKIKKRLIGVILVLSLIAGMAPMPVQTVKAATEDKMIMSGVSGIAGQQADSIYFGTYSQSANGTGFYVEPIKWRILENANEKLFVLADQNLDSKAYHKSEKDVSITWEESSIRSWLNGTTDEDFFGAAFSTTEQEVVNVTAIENADNECDEDGYEWRDGPVEGGNDTNDRIFLISIAEAQNTDYFPDNTSRIATNTAYTASKRDASSENAVDQWRLRSPGSISSRSATVTTKGKVDLYGKAASLIIYPIRPAMNLNLNQVLFTSAAVGGKAVSGMDGALTELDDVYEGNTWKATVIDSSRSNFVASTVASTADTVTVEYEGAMTGNNEYLSAIVADADGAYTHYGRIKNLADSTDASGTIEISVNGVDLTDSTLYVFNEQYNGGANDDTKLTDYASALVELEVESEVPTENKLKAISVPGFKHASSSSFYNGDTQMPDVVTLDGGADATATATAKYPTMKDIQGNTVTSLDRTLLSFQVDFEKVPGAGYTYMDVAVGGPYTGIRIYPGNDHLRIEAAPYTQSSSARFNINVDNDAVTSFAGPFILQLSFEYGDYDADENTDKNDLRLGVYINGKFFEADFRTGDGAAQDGKAIFYNCTENLGVQTYMLSYAEADACDLTVSSVVPENENLTKITWSDFLKSGVPSPDKAFLAKADMGYIYGASLNSSILDSEGQAISKLNNTSFEANLMFTSHGANNFLQFGGNGQWATDMQIYGRDDGNLGSNLMNFNKDIAEVDTFYRKEFTMKITTEYGDFDGDGASDDVQYGFYFNGKLYNDQYYYWIDRTNPGNYVSVYYDGPNGSGVLIRSASYGKDTSYNLASGPYMVDPAVYSDVAKVMLGTESVNYQNGLTTAGDYRIYDKKNKLLGTVVLYEKGNVHADECIDSRDLVALMRLRSGKTMTAHAGNIGAYKTNNFDKATLVNMLLE